MDLLNLLISLGSKSTQKKRYLQRNSHLKRKINVEETFFLLIILFWGPYCYLYIASFITHFARDISAKIMRFLKCIQCGV